MTYNLTQLADSGTVYQLIVFGNDATTGLLISLFVLALFFVMLMALKRYEFDKALLISSFICFVISAFLIYAELMALMWGLLYLGIAAFTAFFIFVLE